MKKYLIMGGLVLATMIVAAIRTYRESDRYEEDDPGVRQATFDPAPALCSICDSRRHTTAWHRHYGGDSEAIARNGTVPSMWGDDDD